MQRRAHGLAHRHARRSARQLGIEKTDAVATVELTRRQRLKVLRCVSAGPCVGKQAR